MGVSDFISSLFAENGYNASYALLVVAYLQTLQASTRPAIRKLGVKDNVQPREAIGEIEASGKYSPRLVAKLKRRLAAHQNSFESLPILVAAVIAGNTTGLSNKYMNTFMLAYILMRGAFIRLYVNTTTLKMSVFRSVAWAGCQAAMITTLIKAGNKLNAR